MVKKTMAGPSVGKVLVSRCQAELHSWGAKAANLEIEKPYAIEELHRTWKGEWVVSSCPGGEISNREHAAATHSVFCNQKWEITEVNPTYQSLQGRINVCVRRTIHTGLYCF